MTRILRYAFAALALLIIVFAVRACAAVPDESPNAIAG